MALPSHQLTKRTVDTQPSASHNISFPYGVPPAASSKGANNAEPAKRISAQRLNPHKCASPFTTNVKTCKTLFSQSYVSGSIPCRLQSSALKQYLQWDTSAVTGFSPDLLIVCADGLSETEHPYAVMAPMMFRELVLRAEGCLEMFEPVMEPVVTNIRKALLSDATVGVALDALLVLLEHTGGLLLPQLAKLLPAMTKAFRSKAHHEECLAVLSRMEKSCGPEALKIIKAKIPTY